MEAQGQFNLQNTIHREVLWPCIPYYQEDRLKDCRSRVTSPLVLCVGIGRNSIGV